MDNQFLHERQLTSGDEIRLLRLSPGSGHSPLEATIQYHHLSGSLDYQALSYPWKSAFDRDHPSWGSRAMLTPTPLRKMLINGGILKITQSLHDALRELRQPDKHLILWVDAIAIDQSHDEEKTWQIQLMREIYERASRVLIWLGPSDATSDIAMSRLQSGYRYFLRSKQHKEFGTTGVHLPEPANEEEFDDQLYAASFGKMFGKVPQSTIEIPDYPIEAVAGLLSRAYWGRGWCWQEFTVAQKIAIMCGEKILDDGDMCLQVFLVTWDMLKDEKRVTPHVLDQRPWSMMDLRRSYRNIVYLTNIGFKDNPSIEAPSERILFRPWAFRNPGMTASGKAWLFRDAIRLLSMKALLQESSGSWLQTGRKEDQIFALLGMAIDAKELGIKVDCSIAWEQVYTQLAVAYAKRSDLWFLHYCQGTLRTSLGGPLSLPSWVPDWSEGYRGAPIFQHYVAPPDHLGSIESNSQPDRSEVDSHGRLRLRGILADKIAWVSPERFPMSSNDIRSSYHRRGLYQWIRDVASQCHPQSRRELWTVMIANSGRLPVPVEYSDLPREVMRDKLDDVLDSILEKDEVEDPRFRRAIDSFLMCFLQATSFRCIFQTKDGRLGLSHTGVRSGDRVVVLMGVRTPFVIRPVTVSWWGARRYQILCESYVNGLMDNTDLKARAVVKDIILE